MSPEQAQAVADAVAGAPISAAVDGRSDVYALGVLLHEALAGGRPQTGKAAPVPLRQLNPRVSVGLADIVHKCLATDPADRYPTAGDLADDLRRHLEGRPLRGVPNRSLVERCRKWWRRPQVLPLYALVAALANALLAGCALLGLRSERPRPRRRAASNALLPPHSAGESRGRTADNRLNSHI
jgi:serine/threonine protein kinase